MVRSPIAARRSGGASFLTFDPGAEHRIRVAQLLLAEACHGPSLQDSSDGDGRKAKAENDGRRLGARPRPAGEKDSTAYERNRERCSADA